MSEQVARVRALVRGRVQQVGFRMFVQRHADRLGLRGQVANRPDGSVEVVAEGPRPAVDQLLARLREGPPMAEVDAVETSEEPPGPGLPPMRVTV